jgi:type II secretory pathway component GspD/PulD (secretin)
MYIRLIIIFFVFLTWGPAAKAQTADAQPKPQDAITLEANVVQIILNDEHRSGVDWGAIVSDFHTALLKKENDPAWNDQKYRLSFGTVSQDDYTVLLDALDTVGEMSQLPQPPIKVTAGTPASISLDKQNIHVDFLLSRLKSGDLSLRILPRISVAAMELFDGQKIPASVLLQAETNVLVEDNTTIVIGGFMKEEEITRKHKFPLLGDIPIVGLVFRSRGHLMQKTETIIFLTMRSNAVDAPEDDSSS